MKEKTNVGSKWDIYWQDWNHKREPEITELKNSVTEMRNVKWSICNRVEQVEHRIRGQELWNNPVRVEENKEKRMKMSQESLHDLYRISSKEQVLE